MGTRLATVIALISLVLAAYVTWAQDQHPTTPQAVAPLTASTQADIPDDYPIRVTRLDADTLRVEIRDYVDGECQGCTEEQAVIWAQTLMSDAIADALPMGEPLYVGEGDVPAYVPAILLDMGWAGRQGDGCECLYPPAYAAPMNLPAYAPMSI